MQARGREREYSSAVQQSCTAAASVPLCTGKGIRVRSVQSSCDAISRLNTQLYKTDNLELTGTRELAVRVTLLCRHLHFRPCTALSSRFAVALLAQICPPAGLAILPPLCSPSVNVKNIEEFCALITTARLHSIEQVADCTGRRSHLCYCCTHLLRPSHTPHWRFSKTDGCELCVEDRGGVTHLPSEEGRSVGVRCFDAII